MEMLASLSLSLRGAFVYVPRQINHPRERARVFIYRLVTGRGGWWGVVSTTAPSSGAGRSSFVIVRSISSSANFIFLEFSFLFPRFVCCCCLSARFFFSLSRVKVQGRSVARGKPLMNFTPPSRQAIKHLCRCANLFLMRCRLPPTE